MYMYLSTLQDSNSDKCHFKWVKSVKNILDNSGFSYVWDVESLDTMKFKSIFNQRYNDIFLQNWQDDITQYSQCSVYKLFKHCNELEKCLIDLDDVHKFNIAKFRTRTHPITSLLLEDDSRRSQLPHMPIPGSGGWVTLFIPLCVL